MKAAQRQICGLIVVLLFACCVSGLGAKDDPPWRAGSLALSHDGRHLAVLYLLEYEGERHTEYDLEIWLYDLEQHLTPPRFVEFSVSGGTDIQFSPDNKLLAIGNYHQLQVFDVASLKPLLKLTNFESETRADFRWIYFSPDSEYIMAFTDWWARDHDMHVWKIRTGEKASRVDARRGQQWIERPWLSPDWNQFFRWREDGDEAGTIYAFDPETGRGPIQAVLDVGGNGGAAFSPDSALFAISTRYGEVQVFETETWNLKNSEELLESTCDEYLSFAFSHRGSLLATTCVRDDRLVVWDFELGEVLLQVRCFGSAPQFTPDDSHVVVSTRFSGIQVWNVSESFELTVFPGRFPLLHPDGELMIAIGPDGYVWIWNIRLERLQLILPKFAG